MALKGLDYDQLFPGRFIKAGDLKGRDVNLTIANVRIEELPQDKGGQKVKGIIAFKETKKELVLNRTNGECLKAMWGRDTGEWLGKRVTLFPAPVNGDLGIRVRGSPDLTAPVEFELKLPRKSAKKTVMRVTKTGKAATAPEPEPEPDVSDAADALVPDAGTPEHDGAEVDF